MAAYLVAQVDVHDPEAFGAYSAKVTAVVAARGGRFIVRGGAVDRREGAGPDRRVVVIEFPSMAAARDFYDSAEYAPLLAERLACATADLILVEGVAP